MDIDEELDDSVDGQEVQQPASKPETVLLKSDEENVEETGEQPRAPRRHMNLKTASKLIISSNQFFKIEKRTLKFSNGDKYSGDFDLTHARYHGKGKFRWAVGAKYEGDWWKGKRTGKGTLKSADGSSYTGEWLHNKRHGMGEFRRFDGATYVGPWVDDKMSGDGGIFTYSNGDRYVGRWVNGQKQGRGEYIYNTDEKDLQRRAGKGLIDEKGASATKGCYVISSENQFMLHRKNSLMEATKGAQRTKRQAGGYGGGGISEGGDSLEETLEPESPSGSLNSLEQTHRNEERGEENEKELNSLEDGEDVSIEFNNEAQDKRGHKRKSSHHSTPLSHQQAPSSVPDHTQAYASPTRRQDNQTDEDHGSATLECFESPILGDSIQDTEPVDLPPSSFLTTPLTPKENTEDFTSSPQPKSIKFPKINATKDSSQDTTPFKSSAFVPTSQVASMPSLPSSIQSTDNPPSSSPPPKVNVKYRGEFQAGLSCGEGESTNEAGDRYFGGWKDGMRHGRGAYRWSHDGKTLRGTWKEGVADGQGILSRPKPDEFDSDEDCEDMGDSNVFGSDDHHPDGENVGQSVISEENEQEGSDTVGDLKQYSQLTSHSAKSSPHRHANSSHHSKKSTSTGLTYTVLLPGDNRKQAMQQVANGQEVVMYEGQFKQGLFHGMGTEYEHDRSGMHLDSTYKGPFHQGLRDSYGDTVAFGRKEDVDGSLYVGWYSEDHAHGTYGDKYDAESGSRYVGSWWNGNRHGTGKRWSKDGSTYEGNWLNDKPHGRGHTRFANGDEYFGEYLFGARHGPGVYNRQDGVDVYMGFWAHGIAKGRGFRRYANGAFYIGDMESNLPHGEGVMRNGDGASWYYGGWRLGKRHGAGVELFGGSGTRFEGVWRNGVKDNSFDKGVSTQSGAAIAPPCEGTWMVRPSVVEDNGLEGDGLEGDDTSTLEGSPDKGVGGGGFLLRKKSEKTVGSYGKYSSFQESASVASTAGTLRSSQVVTYPALYFDPDIHSRIMVQNWIEGKLQFEFADVATVMRPRLPGEEGYVNNEDATSYLLTKAKPDLMSSNNQLPRAYSSTRRRLAGTKSKDAVVFPRNLMPSQVRAPVMCAPLQTAEDDGEFIRRCQQKSVSSTTPFVASNDQFEDRRRVLENSIYDPGQCMFILVDDEILSDGILATPDSASEIRGEARKVNSSDRSSNKNQLGAGGRSGNTDLASTVSSTEPSGAPTAAALVAAVASSLNLNNGNTMSATLKEEESRRLEKRALRKKNRKWVEAVVVRFVGEPGRHQLSICMGPPLDPTSTTLEGIILPLTATNHFSFPVNTSRPPLRTKHLPASEFDLNERRKELVMVKELLACKPSEFSNEQREVSQFVERKAAQVVQDALDKAETTRQENLDRKKKALAEAERLKEPLPLPAFGIEE